MKKIAMCAAALFMILLFEHTPGHAVPAPHDFGCLQCHVSHNSLGTQTNDLVCFSCHNPSGGAKAQTTPFSPGDAANPFTTGGGMQSSHNWSGSDTNLQAGAQPPQDPALALKQHEGRMLCSKCHNLHGPRESAANSAPFLRTLNDRDQMCLDCHRPWNSMDHATGTHPVQVSYSTSFKANPYGFYSSPRSANPANQSASVKLVQGQVVCSTCHGVHYTDSNSTTFDNASSSLMGRLKPSKGMLLRTDMRGARPDDVNLCTNCHKGYMEHNAGGENIQCADCHGGHVAPADGSTPNVWLIRPFAIFSTFRGKVDTRNSGKLIKFQSTVTKNYLDTTGNGVCQPCHSNASTQPECSQPDKNCNQCHRHNNASGAYTPETLGCNSCHGQPPVANVPKGPYGYAEGYVGVDESASAHRPHMEGSGYYYSCNDCHRGNLHGSGDFQQVFLDATGTLAGTLGANPSYDKGARTCSNVYCHSNGAPRTQATVYAAPVPFGNSRGSIIGKPNECVSCHGCAVNGYNNLNTNAHLRHVSVDPATGMGYGCVLCHAGVVSGNGTVIDKVRHVNGAKDVAFSGPLTAGTTSDGASCSTNYCHSNGKGVYSNPSWTIPASGACGSCHATTPAMGSAVISSGAHFAHFSTAANSYGPMLTTSNASGCQSCHSYGGELKAGHVNGAIEVSQSDWKGAGTCAPCHNQATNWNGGVVTCQSCHSGALSVINGKSASDMSRNATQGHGKSGMDCLSCHATNARHLNGGGRIQSAMTGSLNAECRYCHDSPSRVTNARFRNFSTHMTVKGGGGDMGCAVCHDPHGTDNLSQIRNVINGQPIVYKDSSTGLVDTTTNRGLCQVCHKSTAHFRADVAETDHPVKDCLNCHKHNAQGGAFKMPNSCDGCHGYPPAPKFSTTRVSFGTMGNWSSARFESYSGGGGAHLVAAHVPRDAKPSDGWKHCTMCHNGGKPDDPTTTTHKMVLPVSAHISDVTIDVDPKYRFDNSFIVYTGAKLVNPPSRNQTGSCFNISCHMTPSKRWSIER